MSANEMTGTAWHTGFPDKAKDERRHPAKCKHYISGKKYCTLHERECTSSRLCQEYEAKKPNYDELEWL